MITQKIHIFISLKEYIILLQSTRHSFLLLNNSPNKMTNKPIIHLPGSKLCHFIVILTSNDIILTSNGIILTSACYQGSDTIYTSSSTTVAVLIDNCTFDCVGQNGVRMREISYLMLPR